MNKLAKKIKKYLIIAYFIFSILLVVIGFGIIAVALNKQNRKETFQNKKLACNEYVNEYANNIENQIQNNYKPNTIFVSIASYRDSECSDTIESIYSNAKNPENIYIGICEQNNYDNSNELCLLKNNKIYKKYENNIKIHRMNYKEAKGPTYARYFCSKLWSGQQYYFQIDSHTKFVKDWDIHLITMLEQCRKYSNKPVLSAYPPTETQLKTLTGVSVMDNCKISSNGLPIFYAGFWKMDAVPNEPIKSPKPFVAGGFMFLDSTFLNEVPYDPYLSGLFQGEETLFSARLFTNGYDIFAPNILVCTHHYNREGSLYNEDMPDFSSCKNIAEQRVLYLLGLDYNKKLLEGHPDFLYDIEKYGIGKTLSMTDFWKSAGISKSKNKLEKCS